MFAGTIEAKIDSKGRVFFPSEFRRQLQAPDQGLVLRRDIYQPCVTVYPYAVWQAEVAQLKRSLNLRSSRGAAMFRKFLADAYATSLDANGRILVPRRLVDLCNISGTVSFVGQDDRVELWNTVELYANMPTDDSMAEFFDQIADSGTDNPFPTEP